MNLTAKNNSSNTNATDNSTLPPEAIPSLYGNAACTVSSITMLESNFYAISVLNSISNAVALFIDIAVLTGILKAKKLKSGTRIFLANLTIIDLVSAITLQPCMTAYLIIWIKDSAQSSVELLSDVINTLHFILTLASFFAFIAVSVDRYMLVYRQFIYSDRMTKKIALAISTVTNLSAVVSYIIPRFIIEEIFSYYSVIIYVSIALLLGIHARIMITARKTHKKIQKSAYVDRLHQKRLKRRYVEIKQSSVTAGIFLAIIICYLPLIIVNQIPQRYLKDTCQKAIVIHWALFLMMACPIGKQLLLCILNKAIRAAIRRWIFLQRDQSLR